MYTLYYQHYFDFQSVFSVFTFIQVFPVGNTGFAILRLTTVNAKMESEWPSYNRFAMHIFHFQTKFITHVHLKRGSIFSFLFKYDWCEASLPRYAMVKFGKLLFDEV